MSTIASAVKSGKDEEYTDKLQSITQADFRRKPPVIKDEDPDLDRHDREFDNMVSCFSVGGKRNLRPIDIWHMYESSFPDGSTRRKVYKNCDRVAQAAGRLPDEAAAVLQECRAELRTYIWETQLQKETRVEREFEVLEQGCMSHADFRALFASKLQDMKEANLDMPTDAALYRKYLTKLAPELRTRVLSKEWKIDGPDKPARNPKSHREVAIAVGLCLEEKADIYCTGQVHDSLMTVESAGSTMPLIAQGGRKPRPRNGGQPIEIVCNYCHLRNSHYSHQCPQKFVDSKPGLKEQYLQRYL